MNKLKRFWYHIWDFLKYTYKEWDASVESRLTYDGKLERKIEERLESFYDSGEEE